MLTAMEPIDFVCFRESATENGYQLHSSQS